MIHQIETVYEYMYHMDVFESLEDGKISSNQYRLVHTQRVEIANIFHPIYNMLRVSLRGPT